MLARGFGKKIKNCTSWSTRFFPTRSRAHSPTFPSLHLRHSSFSNPSIASPTSQLILQRFFRFSYVTGSSLTSPGEPPMGSTMLADVVRSIRRAARDNTIIQHCGHQVKRTRLTFAWRRPAPSTFSTASIFFICTVHRSI